VALILGEDEVATATVGVKFLRESRPQETVEQVNLADFITAYFED
jgi:histidyl-tRNA synthetase